MDFAPGLTAGLLTIPLLMILGIVVAKDAWRYIPTTTWKRLVFACTIAPAVWLLNALLALGEPTSHSPVWIVGDAVGLFVGYMVAGLLARRRAGESTKEPDSVETSQDTGGYSQYPRN